MRGKGFEQAFNLAGGIKAWKGRMEKSPNE